MIQVKNLTKCYGDHTAVSDLSFTVEKGQIYGFLGPNGAGKSTTMNIMTGCLSATAGQVTIGGFDIFENAKQAKKLIGYLPEQPPVYPERTPREYLTFVARAKNVPAKKMSAELQRVMEITGIAHVADRLIKHLSKGYRQRVGIAQAILGDPEVIILDEPTVGLDPIQIIEIRDLIRALGQDHTVILSSHILSEVQAVCTTIMIIAHGQLKACDTPENLEKIYTSTSTVELVAEADKSDLQTLLAPLGDMEFTEDCVRFTVDRGQEDDLCRQIFRILCDHNTPILRLHVIKPTLEDIFLQLTADEKEEI